MEISWCCCFSLCEIPNRFEEEGDESACPEAVSSPLSPFTSRSIPRSSLVVAAAVFAFASSSSSSSPVLGDSFGLLATGLNADDGEESFKEDEADEDEEGSDNADGGVTAADCW